MPLLNQSQQLSHNLLVKTIASAFVFICFSLFFLAPAALAFDIDSTGLDTAAGAAFGDKIPLAEASQHGFASFLGSTIGISLSFVGIIFFILIIYGGFKWMVSRGNEQEIAKAKEIIAAAVIGLLLILSAYAITTMVGSAITSVK